MAKYRVSMNKDSNSSETIQGLCMRSSLLESETVTEFQATEVQVSSHVKKENQHYDENKVYNQYVHLDS
jgi:hypothetical protein